MTDKKAQEQLINFALQEMTDIVKAIQQGKTPTISAKLQALSDQVKKTDSGTTLTPEESERLAQQLVDQLLKHD